MQYVGGKQKSGGQHIAKLVKDACECFNTSIVCEPFCGGLSVTYRLIGLDRHPSDACESLITLYTTMQKGWVPPDEISRELWLHYKENPDPTDPLTAFIGFGCSRSGAYFSSFVDKYKYTNRVVPAAFAAKQSLQKKLAKCQGVVFRTCDYTNAKIQGVIYCDPPYVDSLGYPAVGTWNALEFWNWARLISKDRPVLVSERVAPEDFIPLASWSIQGRITTSNGNRRTEAVFVHESWQKKLKQNCNSFV